MPDLQTQLPYPSNRYSIVPDIWKTLSGCWISGSKLLYGNKEILIMYVVKMIGLELFLFKQRSGKVTTNTEQEAAYRIKLCFQNKSQHSKYTSAINTLPKHTIQSNVIKSSPGIHCSWVFMNWFWKEFPVWVRISTCDSTFTHLTRYKEAILNTLEYNHVIDIRYQLSRLCQV